MVFPTSETEEQTVNYYDDYTFLTESAYNYTGSTKTKGLLTGSKVKVLGTQAMLLEVNYYDDKARLVKNFKQHHLNGIHSPSNYDETENTYNFAGELTASIRVHHAGGATTTIANRYENDHMGRKLATFQSINGANELVLNKIDYNQIGQLLKKSLHGTDDVSPFLQHTSYAYNERGWLKNSTSNEFSQQLNYENGTTPQFNGNIANQLWGTGGSNNNFTYSYDKLNRLTSAIKTGVTMNEVLTYDVMGNISTLNRDGQTGNYNYNGNKLTQITGGVLATGAYVYDDNGNVITDGRNGMNLTYNLLNLPETASKAGVSLAYTYDATGNKLKKTSSQDGIRNYINGIEYNGNAIDIIHTEEGVARNNAGNYSYEYNVTDHLGNVRVTFKRGGSGVDVLQRDDYYAFGLRKNAVASSSDNKYLYNGKELQEELGQYDYGARFYDPIIVRWNVVDPMAEAFEDVSPYNYALNNPIRFTDPDGMAASDTIKTIKLDEVVVKGQSRPDRANTLSQKFTSLEGYVPFVGEYRDFKYSQYQGSFFDYLKLSLPVGGSVITGTPPGLGLTKFNPKDLVKLAKLLKALIRKGQMPSSVKRIDVPKLDPNGNPIFGQQTHIHLKDGRALNFDGTWKHGEGSIPNSVIEWVEKVSKGLGQ